MLYGGIIFAVDFWECEPVNQTPDYSKHDREIHDGNQAQSESDEATCKTSFLYCDSS